MMKKEIAHCGFPETALKRNTDILIELGFKVTRIEQTETPSQMTERCAQMSRPSKFDKGMIIILRAQIVADVDFLSFLISWIFL